MQCMISKSNVKFTDSNAKSTDSEVRMASQFASSTQQEIEKLLEDKDSENTIKDRQKWQRNCSRNTLKRKISRSHLRKRN